MTTYDKEKQMIIKLLSKYKFPHVVGTPIFRDLNEDKVGSVMVKFSNVSLNTFALLANEGLDANYVREVTVIKVRDEIKKLIYNYLGLVDVSVFTFVMTDN